MEQWHYDPAAELDQRSSQPERTQRRARGLLIRMARIFVGAVLRCWLRVYHRLVITGRQHLPAGRSFVLVANHASHLDTLCLLAALPLGRLNHAYPVAAQEYFAVRGALGLFAELVVNALPLDRRRAPWQSLGLCAQLLRDPGNIVILFPEGTRSGAAVPAEFKPGAALLVAGRDVAVVPCHLAGTHAALPKGSWCPRPRSVRLTIGAPRDYSQLPATRESVRQICRELREAVIDLGGREPADRPDEGQDCSRAQPQALP